MRAGSWVPALLVLLSATGTALAADKDPKLDTPAQKEAPTAFAAKEPAPVLDWGAGRGKSHLVPAYEIAAFEFLLNRFDFYSSDREVYKFPTTNLKTNWDRRWVVDNDKFATNQFLHPYQGSIYQGFARSAGLGFWTSFLYALAGSLAWEEAGESTTPSINDQVASGIGGNFLGEPLFRMASLLLESGSHESPTALRELGATLISPPTGFNRLAYGKRFDGVFRSYAPAVFTRAEFGVSVSTHFQSNINVNADRTLPPATQTLARKQVAADFTMGYGLPGKPGYAYSRPFDYFAFEFIAATDSVVETIFSDGLMYGNAYEIGKGYRGIWGLYADYSYVAPQIFRVSTTATSFGTTGQCWLSRSVALQGSALVGLGYGAGGVVHGAGITQPGPNGEGRRDYHYGVAPQGLVDLRLILGDRVSIDTKVRDFYISDLFASESAGTENIVRADFALTIRAHNLQGLTLRYSHSVRDGRYAGLPRSYQTIGTVSLGYTLVGHTQFGAVDWRDAGQQ